MQARPLNSWDLAKIIGLLLMVCDHTGAFLYPEQESLRAIGRAAPPVFLFLAGYAASYRFRPSLLILAATLGVAHTWLTGAAFPFNILFTILIARLILDAAEKRGIRKPAEWVVAGLIFFPSCYFFQYGSVGLLFALCGYLQRNDYPPAIQQRTWAITFLSYGAIEAYLFHFTWSDIALMVLFLSMIAKMLYRMPLLPVFESAPKGVKYALRMISAYSGYLYVGHYILLEALQVS